MRKYSEMKEWVVGFTEWIIALLVIMALILYTFYAISVINEGIKD